MLCGQSGCGKTTLLRLLKEETAPKGERSGEICCRYESGNGGYVFQNPEMQIVTDKVWHELAFACENKGWSREKIRRRVGEISAYFGLQRIFHSDTAILSGGQKQRLNLAAAVVTEPEILFLDEPTSQLDPIAAESFMGAVGRLNRDFGITVIMSEHNADSVFPMADRVAYMDEGKIETVLSPREIGTYLRGKPMFGALPCAARIAASLGEKEPLPITAAEGKATIRRYDNKKTLPLPPRRLPDEVTMEVKNLSFRYKKDSPEVLRNVSFKVHKGEIFSILGENGVGKSTLLEVMSGILAGASGRIRYNGRTLKSYGVRLYRGNIAMLVQDPQNCFTRDTLREDWAHMAMQTGFSGAENLARRLRLWELMDSHPYDLSGGEQQRAALGKVLMQRPRLLLLDEPAKGLDAVNKNEMAQIISEVAKEGTAVVIATHDTEMAAQISHTCAMMFDGEIISPQSPEKFFSENIFYTTPAAKISRGYFENAVTPRRVTDLCRLNGEKHEQ